MAKSLTAIALALVLLAPPVIAQVRLSEFMAVNDRTLMDEDGEFPDWIELRNPGNVAVDLAGWFLTDDTATLTRWRFPDVRIAPGGYLVVFASGKDRRDPGARLHTNFKLASGGGFLGLVDPTGTNIVSGFGPGYPVQLPDISYGYAAELSTTVVLGSNTTGRVFVPVDASLGSSWTLPAFDDAAWRPATNGIGYETGGAELPGGPAPGAVDSLGPVGFWRLEEAGGTIATNLGLLAAAGNGSLVNGVTVAQAGPRPPAFPGFDSGNRAARFDGVNDRIDVPFSPTLNPPVFTASVWARVAGGASTYRSPLTSRDVGPERGYLFYAGDNNLWQFWTGNGAGWNVLGGPAVVPGQWVHLAGSFDGTTLRFYVNGTQVASANGVVPPNTARPLRIGGGATEGDGQFFFNGDVDEAAVFARALSASEVRQLFQSATNGVAVPDFHYTGLYRTDLRSAMHHVNASAYARFSFVIDGSRPMERLILRLRYDDGWVAHLNGQLVAAANAPDAPAWNSTATARHANVEGATPVEFDLSAARGFLLPGTNILAIHGLNLSADDPDFLLQPELLATTSGNPVATPRYFRVPTPGGVNGVGSQDVGPVLDGVAFTPALPARPLDGDAITVTARVRPAFAPVTNITLRYRVMFGVTNNLPMVDDGQNGDGAAGDGVYGAVIPAAASGPGQMVRFHVTAQDAAGRGSRWPLFEDTNNSPAWLGTVVANPGVTSALPVWEWFAENVANARNRTGTRGAVFFNGEFHDHVFIRERGGFTSLGSQKFDFNTGHHLRINDTVGRVEEANLNSNGGDPSYMRVPLCWDVYHASGQPACHSFPLLLRLNGGPDRVAHFVEEVDERFLDRHGFDRDGALYKFVQRAQLTPGLSDVTDGVEKKTRMTEDRVDLQSVVNAMLLTNNPAARSAFMFDHLDLPSFVNFFAVRAVLRNIDCVRKNFYLYRDTEGTGEWSIFPWDMDLTWGNSGSLDNEVHPFHGDVAHRWLNPDQWNWLWEALFNDARTRPMILRRMRSVMDQQLGPAGLLEARVNQFFAPAFPHLGAAVSNEVNTLRASIAQRRSELYVTYAVTNPAAGVRGIIPEGQPPGVPVAIASWDYNPASGRQDEEYLCLTNPSPSAVDVSGWRIDGGIRHTVRPGTVIRAGDVLYLSPDVTAFRARTTGPRGGQGLLVQGAYEGRLSARGESLALYNDRGTLVHSNNYPGTPSPAQLHLRITEIMYHPAPLAGSTNDADEFEYVELHNLGPAPLDLTGVRFTSGIGFDFTGSAVTSLAPGARVLVVKNAAAFALRHGAVPGVAGEFSGHLDNAGERLVLIDATGEEILDFSYNNAWHPITDGLGMSLVVVDEFAPWTAWGDRSQWRPSGIPGGSPGTADPSPPATVPVLINEVLTASIAPDVDVIELHNPSAQPAAIGGWYLSDNFFTPRKHRIPEGTVIAPGGFLILGEGQFGAPPSGFALDSAGDDVWLFAANAAGELTGYHHGFDFGPAEPGVSLGRHVNSQGEAFLVPQRTLSAGSTNTGPRAGPIVVSEIMYQPSDLSGAGDDGDGEFIELQNVTGGIVPLFDPHAPTNTWRLRNAVDFDFPAGRSLPAGGRLLVVGFDPAMDPVRLARFRAAYELDAGTVIVGPWSGRLDNSGEPLELKKPFLSASGETLFSLVERIEFRPRASWPAGAAGIGSSLQRIAVDSFGNDPTNWFGAGITPGGASRFNLNPTVRLLSPVDGSRFIQPTNIVLIAAPLDTDGTIVRVEFFSDGNKVGESTTPPFSFTRMCAPFGAHVVTARARDNLLGTAISTPANITVASQPPQVAITAPVPGAILAAGVAVPVGVTATDPDGTITNVTLRVDGQVLGSHSVPPFTLNWTPAAGPRQLTAVAVDNSGTAGTSAPVTVRVATLLRTNLLLVASNSVWRYLETATTPNASWITPEFDDTAWKSGPAQLGYGDSDEATRVTNTIVAGGVTNRLITHYFRRQFTIDSLVGVTNVLFRVLRDDGAVGYLNGIEVFRSNMATGRITATNLALVGVSGNEENTFIPTNLPVTAVRPGINTIAVEVHQNLATSPDMSFAAELLLQKSLLGPVILRDPADATAFPGETVTLGVSAAGGEPLGYQWFFNDTSLSGATSSNLVLTALTPAQSGPYRVVVTNAAAAVTSAVATLTVASPDTDGDGLPDDWETASGTNPLLADAAADPDGDGLTNREEFIAGTLPLDPASVLRISSLRLADGGSATVVTFAAVGGRSYTLLTRTTAADAAWVKWIDLPGVTQSGPVSLTNGTSGATERYYRIVTPRQP